VLFTEGDEQTDLPAPTTLSDLQSASLEQKAMMSLQPHNMRIEEAMPTYEDTYYPPYQPTAEQQQPIQETQHQDVVMHSISDNEDEEEARIRERAEARARAQQAHAEAKGGAGPMKIRSDYVPRAAQQAATRRGVQMALCPNCKQQIPYNELDEHMRSMSPYHSIGFLSLCRY
jgi:splicing factor 3A subunit 1